MIGKKSFKTTITTLRCKVCFYVRFLFMVILLQSKDNSLVNKSVGQWRFGHVRENTQFFSILSTLVPSSLNPE